MAGPSQAGAAVTAATSGVQRGAGVQQQVGESPLTQVIGAGMGAAEQPLMGPSSPISAQWWRAAAHILFRQVPALPSPVVPLCQGCSLGDQDCSSGLHSRDLETTQRRATLCAPQATSHLFSLIDCRKQFTKHKLPPMPSSACPGIA